MNEMNLRKMEEQDVAAVAPLLSALGYPVHVKELSQRLKLLDPEANCVFVAVSEGRIVGWVHVVSHFFLMSSPRAEIVGLIVEENSRTKGVGRQLVAAAEKWARSKSLVMLRVTSNLNRDDSHPFYKKLGLELTKQSAVYNKRTLVSDDPPV